MKETIDKKPFAISLAVAVPILAAVWWGAASIAQDRGHVDHNTRKIEENKKSIDELRAYDRRCAAQFQTAALQANSQGKDIQYIKEAVDEIREHMK